MFDRFLSTTKVVYNKVDSFIDNVKSNKVWYSTLWFFVIALSFAILLFLNILTPLISDDITYLFVFGETDRISSIADVIQSQINHYYMWGGRSVVHFIAQVLLMLPSYVADILNTMMYLVYVSLIYYHIKGKDRKNSLSLFVLINMAIWFFQPVFGDTILWTTGASNYLWGTTIILLFLIPYRIYNGTESKLSLNLVLACTLFVWGVMAGWTNENTAGAMILMVVLFLLYYRSNRWRVPVWGVFGLIGSLIGFSIMILAPGNFERAGGATSLDLYVFAYRLFNYTLFKRFDGGTYIHGEDPYSEKAMSQYYGIEIELK